MNKKVFLGIVIVLILIVVGFSLKELTKNDVSLDEINFKKEYESLNDKNWEINGYNGKYLKMNLPENNLMKYATDDNIVDLISKGTQVIYFGNAKCNWCRSAIPVLIETAKEYNLSEIYYYDFFSLRDAYEEGINKNLINVYDNIIEKMGQFIENTFDENSKVAGKKRLSAPMVVIVSAGEVIDLHYKTVKSHIDYDKDLNNNQKDELKQIYAKMLEKLVYVCDEGC